MLVIAYCRHDSLNKILEIVEKSNASSVYISIDAPASDNPEVVAANSSVIQASLDFKRVSSKSVFLHIRNNNSGCAASILTSCDWFFSQENFGIVLEDDCIPSEGFFKFVEDCKPALLADNSNWLISGAQFAPTKISGNSANKSVYAFIWGWATTRQKWQEFRAALFTVSTKPKIQFKKIASSIDELYWYSGYRRALGGFVDAWDSPLLFCMYKLEKFAILPSVNLVTNVGDDEVAVHTRKNNPLLRVDAQAQNYVVGPLIRNHQLDSWIRKEVYKIRPRHIVTNLATAFLDNLVPSRRRLSPLKERIGQSEIVI